MAKIKIKAYIGSAVELDNLFMWQKYGDKELGEFRLLKTFSSIMKRKTNKRWKKIEITVKEIR
jgi:hypothetical protein